MCVRAPMCMYVVRIGGFLGLHPPGLGMRKWKYKEHGLCWLVIRELGGCPGLRELSVSKCHSQLPEKREGDGV